MDVEALDRWMILLARGKEPAERIGLARRPACQKFGREVIEPSRDRELGGIAFSLAAQNECFELAVDAVVRIEHVSPELDRKTGSPAVSRAGSGH
ncbi:hypothetical protein D3C71_2020850 [compost metagenome]